MKVALWLNELRSEAHDDYGAISIPMGIALAIGGLLMGVLGRVQASGVTVLAGILFVGLILAALWIGHRRERVQMRLLGRGRLRETLLLRSTWVVLLWCFIWSYLLMLLADARGWNRVIGWRDLPLLLMTLFATYHLTMGVMLAISRWIVAGLIIALLLIVVPGVAALREQLWLAAGLFLGMVLVLSGAQGRQAFRHRYRAR
jgi:hypothetical protein